MKFFTQRLLTLLFLLGTLTVFAQSGSVSGVIKSSSSVGISNVKVEMVDGSGSTVTDENGNFKMTDIPYGRHTIQFSADRLTTETREVNVKSADTNIGEIQLTSKDDDVTPTVSVNSEGDGDSGDGEGGESNVSGLLTASRDPFVSAANFNFSDFRFRPRGYEASGTSVYLNGTPMNDMETGGVFWGAWGGLNDVTRYRTTAYGLQPAAFGFGGMGGATNIDARASHHRKQLRVGYASSNRGYDHRVMATYSTGVMKGGWAFSVSGSRRYAGESYQPGTYYDGWSYFLGVEKRLNSKHTIGLTFLGAPTEKGRSVAITEEQARIADSNLYNPTWGYQVGKKRNANVSTQHQPVSILTHEWRVNPNLMISSSLSYIFGKDKFTQLDWYNAPDPRPDYYRRLPAYITATDPAQAALVETAMSENESLRQVDWLALYEANRNGNEETVDNIDGVAGQSITGKRAHYLLVGRNQDFKKLNFNSYAEATLSDNLDMQCGIFYRQQTNRNYTTVEDLLAADYFLDIDRFVALDYGQTSSEAQPNTLTPNHVAKVGDVISYDYTNHQRKAGGWMQWAFSKEHYEMFLSTELSQTAFWRVGNMQNGRFPDNSLGKGVVHNFLNFNAKAGFTYKINGRNYLYASGMNGTRAPFMRNSYESARSRDTESTGLKNEKIQSAEAGYLLRAPNFKMRVTGYYTHIKDRVKSRFLYINDVSEDDGDVLNGLVSYVMSGIEEEYKGLEFGAEYKVTPSIRINAAVAAGLNTYNNRPTAYLVNDETGDLLLPPSTIYIKNFRLATGAQNAYNLGLSYNSRKFWFATINFNYAHNNWIDINPERRTVRAVSNSDINPEYQEQIVEYNSPLWHNIIDQTKTPAAFTVNLFGGKSWKFNVKEKSYFLYLNVGVNNILNNTNIITGGFEQFRTDYADKDYSKYPNRYYYSPGATYFVSLSLKI